MILKRSVFLKGINWTFKTHFELITGKAKILIIITTLFIVNGLSAQNSISIKDLDLEGDLNLWYDQAIGYENTSLQTGVLADTEKKANNSHPYFESFRWHKGSVVYRNQTFVDVPILYNIEQDVLMIRESGESFRGQHIALNKGQVSSFLIADLKFRNIDQLVDNYTTGYFQILFESNNLTLIAKRSKVLEISSEKQYVYEDNDRYFLEKDSNYYRIKSFSNLKKLFKDNKKELKLYIRNNRFKIAQPETDQSFVRLIDFCNALTTKND